MQTEKMRQECNLTCKFDNAKQIEHEDKNKLDKSYNIIILNIIFELYNGKLHGLNRESFLCKINRVYL